MPRDGEHTRQQLLDAALKLWAERGFTAVSMAEITERAKQRNTSALHYHFGSRDGLLSAVFARHVPGIRERREELLEVALQSDELRPLAEALVLPTAELVTRTWRERAFLRLASDLMSGRSRAQLQSVMGETAIDAVSDALLARCRPLPPQLASMRFQVAGTMVVHATADYSRRYDRGRASSHQPELFISNLIDTFVAAVDAPISAETGAVIDHPQIAST